MRPVKVKKGFKVVYMRLSEHLIKRLAVDEGRNLIKKVDCSHFLDVFYRDTSIFSPWPRKIKKYSVLCFLSFVTEGYFSEKISSVDPLIANLKVHQHEIPRTFCVS